MQTDEMIPLADFARVKNLPPEKVINMIRDGLYVGQKVGNDWFVDRNELSTPDPSGSYASKPIKKELIARNRKTTILVATIVAVGLLQPAILGLVVREMVASEGISVVSISDGARFIVPLTLMTIPPFVFLAVMAKKTASRITSASALQVTANVYLFVCILIGMTGSISYLLFPVLQSFEGLGMFVALWPITFWYVLFYALGGALVAGAAGAIIGWFWYLFARLL